MSGLTSLANVIEEQLLPWYFCVSQVFAPACASPHRGAVVEIKKMTINRNALILGLLFIATGIMESVGL